MLQSSSRRSSTSSIFVRIEAVDPLLAGTTDIENLWRDVERSGIGNSENETVGALDQVSQQGDGASLYRYIGDLLSKFEPMANAIDKVSGVSQF